MNAEQRLNALGLVLLPVSAPAGNYATAVRSGSLLFISAKAPAAVDGKSPKGRLGREYSATEAYALARSVIGVSSLRNGLPLTLRATVEVRLG